MAESRFLDAGVGVSILSADGIHLPVDREPSFAYPLVHDACSGDFGVCNTSGTVRLPLVALISSWDHDVSVQNRNY